MAISWIDLRDEEAEHLKRLGAAVLALWDDFPEKTQNKIYSKACSLRHGPENMLDLINFIDRYSDEIT